MKNSFLKVLSQFTWYWCPDWPSKIIVLDMFLSGDFCLADFLPMFHHLLLGETVVTFSKRQIQVVNHLPAVFDVSNFLMLKKSIFASPRFWWLPVTLTQRLTGLCDIFILICQLCSLHGLETIFFTELVTLDPKMSGHDMSWDMIKKKYCFKTNISFKSTMTMSPNWLSGNAKKNHLFPSIYVLSNSTW